MPDLISIDTIRAAAKTIAPHVVRTPAVESPGLSAVLGVPVALKLEVLQRTGCFKPRGIVNRLSALTPAQRATGLVTVSGGNHGLALANIARSMGIAATICLPEAAPARSKARIEADRATLIVAPDIAKAFEIAEAKKADGLVYIHSYDDPLIIAGHGTAGLEFIADVPDLTDVLISIGGGAFIAGMAVALKSARPEIRVWGVETEGADAMSQALAAGKPVPIKVTSIASTLGAPYVTQRTLDHAKALVEAVLRVPDRDAVAGCVTVAEEAKLWVEPAAGCLVPAARSVVERVGRDARLGLVMCGGNVTAANMRGWIERFGL